MQELKQLSIDETDDSDLLDCYRIAVDFGMPAALKAYEKLTLELAEKNDGLNIKTEN